MRSRTLVVLAILLLLGASARGVLSALASDAPAVGGVVIATEIAKDGRKIDAPAALQGADIAAIIAGESMGATPPASEAGISLAQDLAEPDALYTGRFRTELELLKRLTLLSRIDLWTNINPRADRVAAVRELENRFEDTLAAAKSARQRIVDEGNAVDAQVDALEAEVENTDEAFFSALNQYEAESADDLYRDFVEQKQQLVRLRAEFGQYRSLNTRFREVIPQVEAKQQALRENREALIAGVRVDRETAVAAGVVKNGR